eukprot:g966.t1
MEANSITCNAVISAYRKAEQWQLALAFFKQLQVDSAPMDALIFAAASDAAATGQRELLETELLPLAQSRALDNLRQRLHVEKSCCGGFLKRNVPVFGEVPACATIGEGYSDQVNGQQHSFADDAMACQAPVSRG